MSSPLAEYYRPMRLAPDDAAGHRPASAHGMQSSRDEQHEPSVRPQSVPPGSKVRSLREVQKSRLAAYWLDDSEEAFQRRPSPAGRDPTLEEKGETELETEQPRGVTTRTRGGLVRRRLSRSYAMHVAGRLAGRDVNSGFRSPFGTDYVPVGGAVSAMSGEGIRTKISGGWKSCMMSNVAAQLPPKVLLHLEHTVELKVNSYKFKYFLIDLSDRPLEHVPKKSLNITLTVLAGSGEAYAAMEGEHEYPDERAHTWKFDTETGPSKNSSTAAEADKKKQSVTIVITPSDVTYATSRKKRVVLAVRSEQGFLEYKIKAGTQTFLSGTGIANMLGHRDAKKQAEREKAQDLKNFKTGISQSYLRTRRAMSGQIPPPKQDISISAFDADRLSSAIQSPLAVTVEDNSSKKKTFAATLDSALTSFAENPTEFLKTMSAEAGGVESGAVVVNAGGGTTQRAGNATCRTSRSTGLKTGRSMYSARSFSQLSMMSSRSSTKGKGKCAKGVATQVDEDLQKLERGEWFKPVLKARVPAAMRLEWALQELEVQKGTRTGETAMRRYIKTMPRDVRKRDHEQNMSQVLVSSTIQLGSGPIMTPDILQSLHGEDYRAGEYFIISQQDGRIIPPEQPRIPSLKLDVLEDDLTPQGAAAQDRDDGRLNSAREHQPQSDSKKGSGDVSSKGGSGSAHSGQPNSSRGKGVTGAGGSLSSRGKGQTQSGGMSARDTMSGGLSYRSGASDGPDEGLFADDDKLALALYELNVQQYATKYSKTQEFVDKLAEGQPAAEVGVSLPSMVEMLMDMKIISTSKSSAIGKRDINSIGREIFHERALDHHPSDDEIILSLDEFKAMLERITVLLGKPYYADRVRPKGVDKELWKRLKEDINPTNRLHRISKQENFRRLILKAFGKYNKKADGKLLRDEYVDLCKGELGLTKPQAITLLEPAGVYPLFKHMDLHTYAQIFIAAEEAVTDVRDTDEARSRSLDLHHMLQNVKASTSSISSDYLHQNAKHIEAFQLQARQASEAESKDIVKTGWLYRQEASGRAKLWRMYFVLVESHIGGTVLRLFTSPIVQIYHSKAALEAAGQIEELWVDGDDPAQVVVLADAHTARQQALEAAAARGQNFDGVRQQRETEAEGRDQEEDAWGQCTIKVVCRPMGDVGLGDRKAEYLKLRGCLVEDEAEDWVQAIRQGMQKRQLYSGDTLKEIQPVAKASEDLRSACKLEQTADPVESLLVKDVTTSLLEALRPTCIIQPTFDKEGVISLAKSKQEEVNEDAKGKKKKIKAMETITEETPSALRAFLTTRRSETA